MTNLCRDLRFCAKRLWSLCEIVELVRPCVRSSEIFRSHFKKEHMLWDCPQSPKNRLILGFSCFFRDFQLQNVAETVEMLQSTSNRLRWKADTQILMIKKSKNKNIMFFVEKIYFWKIFPQKSLPPKNVFQKIKIFFKINFLHKKKFLFSDFCISNL